MFLHNTQELDNDFGARANEYLAFSSFLGVVDGVKRIIEYTCFDHLDKLEILSSMVGGEVSSAAGQDPC